MRPLSHVVRLPALHFVAAGAVLWLVLGPARREAPPRPRIVLGGADVERLAAGWERVHGSRPGRAATAALVDDAIEEEVLVRSALALGLERDDRVVRARLGGLLGGEDAAARGAVAESDVVVRRHLAQTMRLAAGRLDPADLPSEADLERHLVEHAARFTDPERVTLTHVYLGRERRGDAVSADARRLLTALVREGTAPEAAVGRGDPFALGARVRHASATDLERVFGPGFAPRVAAAPLGAWSGPVPSSYGLHLVWVEERRAPRPSPLPAVRSQVLHRVLDERRAERRRARMEALRARFEVAVERDAGEAR